MKQSPPNLQTIFNEACTKAAQQGKAYKVWFNPDNEFYYAAVATCRYQGCTEEFYINERGVVLI